MGPKTKPVYMKHLRKQEHQCKRSIDSCFLLLKKKATDQTSYIASVFYNRLNQDSLLQRAAVILMQKGSLGQKTTLKEDATEAAHENEQDSLCLAVTV